ncbi:MAG: tyrosine-type recombinase/integrase [Eggerthellaceae bacterium]|nr:tyrosine-type recombinase/integrase [Eggerthellaceae bacterium]
MKEYGYSYKSVFAKEIYEYLDYKKSLRFFSHKRNWTLHDFDQYCLDNSVTEFDRDSVEGYVMATKKKCSSKDYSWMSIIRDFGRYMAYTSDKNAYVLSDDFVNRRPHNVPFIMSEDEIVRFFECAKAYSGKPPWSWEVYPLFSLMHALGLRTCEICRLKTCDIDFDRQLIDINWSKAHRSRRLPLGDALASLLFECERNNSTAFGSDRVTFFINAAGNPVNSQAIGKVFSRIWSEAGLCMTKAGKRVRPYDFRHHFAYANIEKWQRQGINPDSMMAYLGAFMGHADPQSTNYYIHTSMSFLEDYYLKTSDDDLYPKAGFDE